MIHQDNELLREVRKLRCMFCGAEPPNDPHHLFGRGMGGAMRMDVWWNLVPLCRMCHGKAEEGIVKRDWLCEQSLQHHFYSLNRMTKEKRELFQKLMADYLEFLKS